MSGMLIWPGIVNNRVWCCRLLGRSDGRLWIYWVGWWSYKYKADDDGPGKKYKDSGIAANHGVSWMNVYLQSVEEHITAWMKKGHGGESKWGTVSASLKVPAYTASSFCLTICFKVPRVIRNWVWSGSKSMPYSWEETIGYQVHRISL
jgi:hypothetical protein